MTYYPATEDQAEYFTWEIKVPVESTDSLQLTYTLTLVDKSTVPGDYTEPTNEEAVLDYTSTTGETGEEPFPVPEVTYTVPKPNPLPIRIPLRTPIPLLIGSQSRYRHWFRFEHQPQHSLHSFRHFHPLHL